MVCAALDLAAPALHLHHPLCGAACRFPSELYEAAAHRRRHAAGGLPPRHLPLLMPAMLIAMLFRYIFAFRLFSEVWLLTGGGPARTTEVRGGLSLSRSLPLQHFRRRRGDRLAHGARLAPARAVLPAQALPGDVRAMPMSATARLLGASLKAIGIVAIVAWSIAADRADRAVAPSSRSATSSPSTRALQLHADAGQLRACSGAAGAISSTGCGTA